MLPGVGGVLRPGLGGGWGGGFFGGTGFRGGPYNRVTMAHLADRRASGRVRVVAAAVLACGMASGMAGVAEAQPGRPAPIDLTEVRPPTPGKQDVPPTIRSYMLLGLLVAAAVGANTIPSKRGHQD